MYNIYSIYHILARVEVFLGTGTAGSRVNQLVGVKVRHKERDCLVMKFIEFFLRNILTELQK